MNMQPVVVHERPTLMAAIGLLTAARLPTEDLTARHCEHFFYCGPREAPQGLVGVELLGHVALLRSLVVAEELRAQGAGSMLLAHAERHARDQGAERIYLLTTTAAEYFRRHGYVHVSRTEAPEPIRATSEYSALCPASAAFMSKALESP